MDEVKLRRKQSRTLAEMTSDICIALYSSKQVISCMATPIIRTITRRL